VPKYALDANVYIDAFRSPAGAEALKRFLTRHLPVTYLGGVVIMELRIGARTKEQSEALEDEIFAPFEKRGRIFVPSAEAFKEAGRVLAALAKENLFDLRSPNHSLIRDSLLAASCRERGLILVTNDNDYLFIKRHLKAFRYVAPWP
jgi:predicted nucleic acid-binding protein